MPLMRFEPAPPVVLCPPGSANRPASSGQSSDVADPPSGRKTPRVVRMGWPWNISMGVNHQKCDFDGIESNMKVRYMWNCLMGLSQIESPKIGDEWMYGI